MYETYLPGYGWFELTAENAEDAREAAKSIGGQKVRLVEAPTVTEEGCRATDC